ncbi:MAG TPA: integrase [Geobacter sp.]|nr:integrase [Geobacter sp.]
MVHNQYIFEEKRMDPKPIEELVAAVLKELDRLNYSKGTRNQYKWFYNTVIRFAKSEGELFYSEELGNNFLRSHYNFSLNGCKKPISRTLRRPVRAIRVLGDYQLHGSILRRHSTKEPYVHPQQFVDVLMDFEEECTRRCYSPHTIYPLIKRLRYFIDYLDNQDVVSCSNITGRHLSQYVRTLFGYNSKTVGTILTSLRIFLKFLYLKGYHSHDISCEVPRLKSSYYPRIPSVWKADDVKRLLAGVDRGNPTGKRDYAILLMVTRLGMRVGDIRALQLSHLKWDTKSIEIVQQKTSKPVSYPILNDIGWAIIDYLQHGRPKTASPHLFVRHNAPFEPFGMYANLHNLLAKYTRIAGIGIPLEARHGMHSLRHTLASVLLEQHTPLPIYGSGTFLRF